MTRFWVPGAQSFVWCWAGRLAVGHDQPDVDTGLITWHHYRTTGGTSWPGRAITGSLPTGGTRSIPEQIRGAFSRAQSAVLSEGMLRTVGIGLHTSRMYAGQTRRFRYEARQRSLVAPNREG